MTEEQDIIAYNAAFDALEFTDPRRKMERAIVAYHAYLVSIGHPVQWIEVEASMGAIDCAVKEYARNSRQDPCWIIDNP